MMTVGAEEIASALGITKRGANKKAAAEAWPCVEVTGRGGKRREYFLSQLPEDIQKALAKHKAAQEKKNLPALRGETLPAVIQPVEALKGWQRDVLTARTLVLRHLARMEDEVGGPAKAANELIRQAEEGLLPAVVQAALTAASLRRGKAVDRVTLWRWKKQAAAGVLAPAERENKAEPPWAMYFIACWHKPGRPSVPDAFRAMQRILPKEVSAPTLDQVKYWNSKRSLLEREKGRRTGGEYKALKPYWERDTKELRPLEVCLCDGHSFKAAIKSWKNGRPVHPEICYVVDAASRAVLGWSVGLAESAETVMTAVLRAALHGPDNPFGGVPSILYTDMGAGNMAKVNTHEVYGFFGKIGITHETGIPGNAQGRGLIERLNQTLWIKAARELPSCAHKMFDRLAQRNFHLAVERDYAKNGDTELLLNLKQFVQYIAEKVREYNNTPHTSLPKITDQETGGRRHMSPYEYLAWHAANGWNVAEHQLPLEVLGTVSAPSEPRIAQRGRIRLRNNWYYCKELAHVEGEAVYVTEADAEGYSLKVHDETGTLIGTAEFEKHKSQYFPQTRRDEAAKNRLENREKLLLAQLDDVRSEYRGTLEMQPVRLIADDALLIEQRREALAIEMQKQEEPKKEAKNPLRMSDLERFDYWQELDAAQNAGGILEEKELRFYESFRKSAAWKAMTDVQENLKQQQA